MNNTAHNKGLLGEKIAKEYCVNNLGYEFITQRYKTKYGEIDLVMKYNNVVIFIEVKYRKNGLMGDGLIAISQSKQAKFRLACEEYIQKNEIDNFVRIDAIEIINQNINYIQNAF